MNAEDKLLLNRLDGFLDATSLVKSTKRDLMCAAVLVENFSSGEGVLNGLKEFYRDANATVTFVQNTKDWVPWLEGEFSGWFQSIDDQLKFELIWQQLEMLRLLVENKNLTSVAKYAVSLSEFEGSCYTLDVDGDLIVIQFLSRLQPN